ncbi:MAG: lipoyl(octanoyl) transferase LipB [Dehalococcoidia bacterium]
MNDTLLAAWLGRVPYGDALTLQRGLHARRAAGEIPDALLLLEHPHVVTLGRRGSEADLLVDAAALEAMGVAVAEADRGGEATYHGPGQLVAYPIIDLRARGLGPVSYVRALEQAAIDTLARHGVAAHRVDGVTGVWTGGDGAAPEAGENPAGRKIAAIGVRISRGVSMHGLALNVSTDLSYFERIVPCGMPDLDVTSIAAERGEAPPVEVVADGLTLDLASALGLEPERVDAVALAGAH